MRYWTFFFWGRDDNDNGDLLLGVRIPFTETVIMIEWSRK